MSRISVFILLAITFGLNLPGQTSPNVSDDWRALRQEGARQFDANNLAQADALFTRALEMARATSDPRAIVRSIEELGIIYYKSNRYEEAKRCFTEVMEIAKQVKDLDASAVVSAYNYFGLTERDLYHYAASVAWHRRALDFLLNDAFPRGELSSEERATRSKLRAETEFALGVALHVYGLHKEAEEHYRNALETSKDHKGLDNLDTVRALTGL